MSYDRPQYGACSFFTNLINMNGLIPISLYVSMEVVKLVQAPVHPPKSLEPKASVRLMTYPALLLVLAASTP